MYASNKTFIFKFFKLKLQKEGNKNKAGWSHAVEERK